MAELTNWHGIWMFEDKDDQSHVYRAIPGRLAPVLAALRDAPHILRWEQTDRTVTVGPHKNAPCIRTPRLPFQIRPQEMTRKMVQKLLLAMVELAKYLHSRGFTLWDMHEGNVAWWDKPYYLDLDGVRPGTDYNTAGYGFVKMTYLCARYLDRKRAAPDSHDKFNIDSMRKLGGWYSQAAKLDYSKIDSWDSLGNYVKSVAFEDPKTHWSDEYALLSAPELVVNGKFITVNEIAPGGETLLDIGCNKGYLTHLLGSRFKYICGMDLCEKSINIAQARHGGHGANYTYFRFEEFIKNSSNQLSRYAADVVIALAVEHHFHDAGMKVQDVARAISGLTKKWLLMEFIKNEKAYGEAFPKFGLKVHTIKPSVPSGRKLVLFERT